MESKQVEPDVFQRNCGSRQVIDRIGDRWSVLVVLTLATGSRRYGELATRIDGISQKMLTQTLRGLERDGLVTRTVHASVPPRVDYALTDLGHSLRDLVSGLESWATTHLAEVQAARLRYDADDPPR
ncbi:helix-turn-helix domain-containing protein [Micromonospora sp. WMMD987]|jgi:DNA-binding HxlR family transcriptional regulator|uniref:winged helix-turn-helix transcriptional regulator n=1 Tax=Micromonospora rifamycinica TaxID=291594 RepID=UPI00249ABB2C|nr:helix-turn-helix domain-containing protein [Micromonospora sp. WMMD987]WFE93073.1 helix-turn-helix domain-containing protein [Micromonospora sp. WMMD987]